MIYACILIRIKVNWNETSAAKAAEEDDDVDYTNLESGCSGFPWSKMRRADDEEECKYLIKAEEEQAGDQTADKMCIARLRKKCDSLGSSSTKAMSWWKRFSPGPA